MSFENFPYTNFHDLNLDWILQKMKDLVKEWAEMREDFSNLERDFVDLKKYVVDYFNNLDLTSEVEAILDKWLLDGTIENLLNQILAKSVKFNSNIYSTFVENTKIVESKITDTAQGFCCDATRFYMFHHKSDDDPMYLMVLNRNGDVIQDVLLQTKDGTNITNCHGNSLNLYNGYLYGAYAGTNSKKILKINPETFECEIITQTQQISALALFTDQNKKDYMVNIVSATYSTVMCRVENNKVIPYYRRIPKSTVPLLKQGIYASSTHIYLPYSGYGAYNFNSISVYTHGLQETMKIFFTNYNGQEMEDIGRIDGVEEMYWNDSEGNIYSFNTTGLFTQGSMVTSFNNPSQTSEDYLIHFDTSIENASCEVVTVNDVKFLKSFSLPYDYYRTWNEGMTGNAVITTNHSFPVTLYSYGYSLSIEGNYYQYLTDKLYPVYIRIVYSFNNSTNVFTLYQVVLYNEKTGASFNKSNITDDDLETIASELKKISTTNFINQMSLVFKQGLNPGTTTQWEL